MPVSRFEFWIAAVGISLMLLSNHWHAEEAACAVGVERACHWHFW